MTQPTPEHDAMQPADAELLELYLDGKLAADRMEEARSRIAEVPAMQHAASQQQLIDEGLKRQFQPPAINEQFLEKLKAAGDKNSSPAQHDSPKVVPRSVALGNRRQQRTRLLAVAASLACLVAWGTFGLDGLKQFWTSPSNRYAMLTVEQVYQQTVDNGFKPDWLCEDDQEFAQTFADRQGQGLLLKPLPPGVQMAGLAYIRGLTPQATSMLAKVDDQLVLIMVCRKRLVSESLLAHSGEHQVSIFERELGDLIAVEVTPHSEPRILDYLYAAEVPAEPTGHVPGTPLE